MSARPSVTPWTTTRSHLRPAPLVAGLTLIALVLRLVTTRQSFFGDELFTYEVATRADLGSVLDAVTSDLELTPPLFFVVAWVSQHLGDPFVWLRVPSLVAGVATVPLVFVLGERTVGRRAGLVGAGVIAVSPLAIFYSVEARAYALTVLLVVLSTLALLQAIETNASRWWVAVALLVAAAMYTHYTSVYLLGAQAGWVLVTQRHRARGLVLAYAGAGLLFLPWLSAFLDDRRAASVLVEGVPITAGGVATDVARLTALGAYAPLSGTVSVLALVLLGAAALLGLVGWAGRARGAHEGARRLGPRFGLVAVLGVAVPAITIVVSLIGGDLFSPRNVITSLPYLALAFGALVTALPSRQATVAMALTVAGFALALASSLQPDAQRPAFRSAARFVEAEAGPDDVVVAARAGPGEPGRVFEVQLDPELPLFRASEAADAIRAAEASGGRILFVYPDVGASPPTQAVVDAGFEVGAERAWSGLYDVIVVVFDPP